MRAPKNRHSTDGIVTSDAVHARKKMSVPHVGRHKRLVLVCLGLLVIALGAYGIFKVFYYKSPVIVDSGDANTYTISDKQYASAQAKQLKSAAPAQGATNQTQITYYDQLMTAQLGAEDYNSVVKDYKYLVTITNDADLTLNIYIDAAKAFAKLGDSTSGQAALNRAEVAVKNQTTNPDRLEAFNQAIALTRQEIQSGS